MMSVFTGATVTLGLLLASIGSAQASTAYNDSTPTPEPTALARQHGIQKPGDATMGWLQSTPVKTADAPRASEEAVMGMDVSSRDGNVDWASWWKAGYRFAYVKATEGTDYKNPNFAQQGSGAAKAGMLRGSYHFALPDRSSGASQANYFIDNGGRRSDDGTILPGAVTLEKNPYGPTCYGLSQAKMVTWIRDFVTTWAKQGVPAVIYTDFDWWKTCTGNSNAFSSTNPLWVVQFGQGLSPAHPSPLPGGWAAETFWQVSDSPVNADQFNGSQRELEKLAARG